MKFLCELINRGQAKPDTSEVYLSTPDVSVVYACLDFFLCRSAFLY